MSRNLFGSLGDIEASGFGDAVEVSHLKAGTVSVYCVPTTSPAWDGTAVIYGSNDGVVFAELPTTSGNDANVQDAALAYLVGGAIKQIKIYCSEYTAGTLYCSYGGEDPSL
jgi:hypothetical protein